MSKKLDVLIARERRAQEAITPAEVEVVLGDQLVTVQIPYLKGAEFRELEERVGGGMMFRDPSGATFPLRKVAREHPGVMLVDGDTTDDLFSIDGAEAVYRWPEVFDHLSSEDQQNVCAVVWGRYHYEPLMRAKRIREAKENDNG